MTPDTPRMEQHPDRDLIQAEAHARPPLAIPLETSDVWHWVIDDRGSAPSAWPTPFDTNSRHQISEFDNGILRFERHTEFVSVTFIGHADSAKELITRLSTTPGRQLAGAHIILSKEADAARSCFSPTVRLFGGRAMFPGVEVSTDFRITPDGFITYAVSGKFEDAYARGRFVKRLIDLETYRMAALLGLPAVRRAMPILETLELRASGATLKLTTDIPEGFGSTISELASLLAEAGALQESIRYRLAASRAYYDIVLARLKSLDEQPIGQRQTLKGFIEHRLGPAIQTIAAFERRLDAVSETVSSAMALTRTRLDHSVQQQNQKLLQSMEWRARQQVHLAQAVEGLSVAAITYYLVGLTGILLKGLPDIIVNDAIFLAGLTPIMVIVVWWITRRAQSAIRSPHA
ncbi:MAG TPA: DUF3422 domain-containing protein [Hyphomonas sp.]|nr:DUF3422 domain-containing protein [Hyphomonas sp.]HRK66003.1 DUF3422 domain-containing protein [Hyphomonas sp.]